MTEISPQATLGLRPRHAALAPVLAILFTVILAITLGNPQAPGKTLGLLLGSQLLYAIAALLTLRLAGSTTLPLSLPSLRQGLGSVLLGLGTLLISASTVARLYNVVESREHTEMLQRVFGELQAQLGPLGLIALTALLVPCCEELLFRGVVQRALGAMGAPAGVVIAALLFGLFHAHPVHTLVAFVLGLTTGYALVATGTLWAPILVHGTNNGIVLLVGIGASVPKEESIAVLPWWAALPGVALVGLGVWLVKRRPAMGFSRPEIEHDPPHPRDTPGV